MGPLTETARFYAMSTGMSEEARLSQNIANDTADGIYVIRKGNHELYYVNESEGLFAKNRSRLGQKCYIALHGKRESCEFYTLRNHKSDGKEHGMIIKDIGQVFTIHFQEIDWSGIPAYVKYIHDATGEAEMRRERDHLEQYFQNMLRNLSGGVAVA